MFDIFPKILLAFLYLLLLITGASILVDVGNMFMIDSRQQYIARNANLYVSKFAVNETDLLEFKKSTLSEDDVKNTLLEYFKKQYGGYGYTLESSNLGVAGQMTIVFQPPGNFKKGTNYEFYGPVTVKAIFKGFGSGGGNATVAFQVGQQMPFTLRGFLETMFTDGYTEYGKLIDSQGKFGYYYVEVERAFRMNTLQKAT